MSGHSCPARIHDGTFRGHLCRRSVKVERAGIWYCAIHDPEKVAARSAKGNARFEAQMTIKRKRWALEGAAASLLKELQRVRPIIHAYSVGKHPEERDNMMGNIDAVIAKATEL